MVGRHCKGSIWIESTTTGDVKDWRAVATSPNGLIQTAVGYNGANIWTLLPGYLNQSKYIFWFIFLGFRIFVAQLTSRLDPSLVVRTLNTQNLVPSIVYLAVPFNIKSYPPYKKLLTKNSCPTCALVTKIYTVFIGICTT